MAATKSVPLREWVAACERCDAISESLDQLARDLQTALTTLRRQTIDITLLKQELREARDAVRPS